VEAVLELLEQMQELVITQVVMVVTELPLAFQVHQ
jgi:hypothetical protein